MWRPLLLVLSVVLNVFLGLRLAMSEQGLPGYQELNRQKHALEEELAALDAQNVGLTREIRLLENNDAYVQRAIRERLHSVRPGEVLYLFPEAEEARTPQDNERGHISTTHSKGKMDERQTGKN